MPLKEKDLRALAPTGKCIRKWDGNGLFFEMLAKGHTRWMFKYAFGGQERRMSLGPCSAVSLKEARLKRDELRGLLAKGIDPSAVRREAKEAQAQASRPAYTVEMAAREWLALRQGWTPKYRENVTNSLQNYVFGPLKGVSIAEATASVLWERVLLPLAAQDNIDRAKRLRRHLEAIWDYVIATERAMVNNVAKPLQRQLRDLGKANPVTNFAAAKPEEIGPLLVALRAYGNRYVEHAVLLQILTAARPGEVRKATWAEFDLEKGLWVVPLGTMKTRRREHLVPLSTQALQVLRSLYSLTGRLPVLFPSRSRWDRPMSDGAGLMALDRSGFGHITLHGMRSLFSTTCNALGGPPAVSGRIAEVVELCLSHQDQNAVRATYNKATLLPERRELLQWYGDYIQGLCDDYTKEKDLRPIFPLDAIPARRS